MLTKQQKSKQIEESKKILKDNQSLVFIDFSGVKMEELKKLRRALREIGAKMKVFKKKLLRIAFKESDIDFNPEQFESQAATVFSSADISNIAGPIYKFYKELSVKGVKDKGFKILGGYDLLSKNAIDSKTVISIGQLPPREILLGQLVGMLSMPIKMFMNVLSEKAKRS